jgi:hypothetical protein
MRTLFDAQWLWMDHSGSLAMNPLQGLGNLFFPFNLNLSPAFWPLRYTGAEKPLAAYVVLAVELVMAAFAYSRTARLPAAVGISGGMLLALLALPTTWPAVFYPLLALAPNCADLLLYQSLLIWTFSGIVSESTVSNVARCAAFVLLPFAIAVANPLFAIVVAPTSCVILVALVFAARDRAQRIWRVGALGASLAIVVFGGVAEYIVGGVLFSVPTLFSQELFRHQSSLTHASIVFQGAQFTATGPALLGASIMGALLTARRSCGVPRLLAMLHVVVSPSLIVLGYSFIKFVPEWRGPQLVYFEMSLWPMFAVFAMALVHQSVECLRGRATAYASSGLWYALPIPALGCKLVLIGLAAAIAMRAVPRDELNPKFPPESGPLIADLRREIGVEPGDRYRGSVATFTGIREAGGTSWMDLHAFDAALNREAGNDHRLVGLWRFGIPTLQEYNHYITPTLYLVASRLLASSGDPQIRNILLLTSPHPPLLASMGVRFLISDEPLDGRVYTERAFVTRRSSGSLRLYELPAANTNGFSILQVIHAETATDMLRAMKSGMDYRTSAVTSERIAAEPLVPATDLMITLRPGGFGFTGRSPGTSLVLLPFQFTNCAKLQSGSGSSRLVRLNLAQLGILFSGIIDAKVAVRSGPLHEPGCRIRDFVDAKRIALQDAGRNFRLVTSAALSR